MRISRGTTRAREPAGCRPNDGHRRPFARFVTSGSHDCPQLITDCCCLRANLSPWQR
jgi:hypothetical protein